MVSFHDNIERHKQFVLPCNICTVDGILYSKRLITALRWDATRFVKLAFNNLWSVCWDMRAIHGLDISFVGCARLQLMALGNNNISIAQARCGLSVGLPYNGKTIHCLLFQRRIKSYNIMVAIGLWVHFNSFVSKFSVFVYVMTSEASRIYCRNRCLMAYLSIALREGSKVF